MSLQQTISQNPLVNLMRQPKIYVRLPSGGQYWESGSIDVPENGEFPVFSMTAQDELALKIPDALMNGQAVVDVIQHCMPNIKNAWACTNLDLDVILIAIRIATYGEQMTVPIRLGEYEAEYSLDLRMLLDQLNSQITWNPVVPVNDDITLYVKPINYRVMSSSAMQTFETQRLIRLAADESIPEEQKLQTFKDSFAKLNQLTVGIINNSVYQVDSFAGQVTNQQHIQEFMNNVDKATFSKVKDHIDKLREINSIKPLSIPVNDEMRTQGITTDTIEYPISFDPSNFFE
jgi:hypothetical protein